MKEQKFMGRELGGGMILNTTFASNALCIFMTPHQMLVKYNNFESLLNRLVHVFQINLSLIFSHSECPRPHKEKNYSRLWEILPNFSTTEKMYSCSF